MNIGSRGKTKYTIFCDSTFTVKFKLPVNKTTSNIAELKINS